MIYERSFIYSITIMNPVRLRGDRMNPVRTIERIIKAPDIHWVGTGFRVRQYFPDSDESPMLDRMSPFLLLDYNEPYYFEGSPFDMIQVTLHIPIKALKR